MYLSKLMPTALLVVSVAFAANAQNHYNLNEIWREAIEIYPSIQSHEAVINRLKAERDLAKTAKLPEMYTQVQQTYGSYENLPGSHFPLPGNFNINGAKDENNNIRTSSSLYGSGVLEWNIFQFGKVKKDIMAANTAVHTGTAALAEEIFRLKTATSRLYLQTLQQTALIRLMEQEEKRFSELLSFTAAQAAAGLIPGADSLLIQSSVRSIKAEKQVYIAERTTLFEQLAVFIGKPANYFKLDSGKFMNPPAGIVTGDLEKHPQLHTHHQLIELAQAKLRAQKSNVYPKISLLAGAGFKGSTGYAKNYADLWQGPAVYLAGVGVTWNFSSLYQNPIKERLAAQKLEEARAGYKEAALHLRANYKAAEANRYSYFEKMTESKEALKLAAEAFDLYKTRYENGLISMIELLQLQKNVQDTEILYVKAVYEYWNELLKAASASGNVDDFASVMGF